MAVTCVSVPVEQPAETLRERIVMAIPNCPVDNKNEEQTTEEQVTPTSGSPPTD